MRLAVPLLFVAAAAAAAILLNLALLGYAQPRNDPVGKLSPRAVLSPGTTPAAPLPAAPAVTPPVLHPGDHERDD
jgi:hypothetical protein